MCFFLGDRKNKMAALASDWLRYFRLLLWNRWTEFNETWQEAEDLKVLYQDNENWQEARLFLGRAEKQDGRPGLWLAETFSASPLKPLNGIQWNLTGSKNLRSSTKFVFFGPIGKTRWPPWPLIGWDIFDFSSETAEQNSTKLDRKQDLNVLYQVCVFGPIGRTRWPPGLWLAETFSTSPLKPLNRIQRNLTGSKILMSSTKFVFFFGRSEKQDGSPWPLAEIFSTSPLKPLNGIQWNLTGSKILRSSTKFVLFLGRAEKQDGRPGLWLAETFSTSPLKPLNRIQRNLTGSKILMSSTNFVFFGLIGKKMAALASDWLRHFRLLLWNRWTEFNETWQEARS